MQYYFLKLWKYVPAENEVITNYEKELLTVI